MTTPSITLDQTLTLTTPATQENLSKGSLEGRSVVPCPSKRRLTDVQIKRIAIIACIVFAFAASTALGAAFTLTLGAGPIGLALGSVGLISLPSLILYPMADFQTPQGAATIRNDLEKESLTRLHNRYNFKDLAKYGYITEDNANTLEMLYKAFPEHERVYYSNGVYDSKRSKLVNMQLGVYDKEARIEAEFNALRNQPGFIL